MQGRGGAVKITFATDGRAILRPECRQIVLEKCISGDGVSYELFAVVVMPDHVHVVLKPGIEDDAVIPIQKITHFIKGSSSHLINKIGNTTGRVWQSESFDRVIRSFEDFDEAIRYVANNPVRKKLVAKWSEYAWTWIAEGLI
jgi:putative transposase